MTYRPIRRRGRRTNYEARPWLRNKLEFNHVTPQGRPWTFPDDDDERLTLDERRWRWVRRRMRRTLPERERRALELHYLEGLTLRECAEELNVHYVTVQRRVLRALYRLRTEARSQTHLWPEALPRDRYSW